MIIRPHRRDDADRIAEILAAGWQQSYSHFMPAPFLLPRIDPARRKIEIAEWLDDDFNPAAEALFVAEDGGNILGFIHMELGDKGELGATGIVNLLYVDPPAQQRGIGRRLLAAGVRWHQEQAPGPLVLSAFVNNPSRFAYDALGGVEAKRVVSQVHDEPIESALYLWADPGVLL
ncbi:MAG: GNAT family N-acetyltransferase [Hyphomicrobiales bacterium]|nr:MAG: GNAT family N-acetyltransferase [Hyphomicrobiales bacterium]